MVAGDHARDSGIVQNPIALYPSFDESPFNLSSWNPTFAQRAREDGTPIDIFGATNLGSGLDFRIWLHPRYTFASNLNWGICGNFASSWV
jgi:hypothetical protein